MRNQTKPVRNRKSVKGMTLIECIISILVVGVTGIIMVTAATTISKLMLETNHINNKVKAESPIGAAQDVTELDSITSDLVAASETADNGKTHVEIKINSAAASYGSVAADRYSTKSAATRDTKNGINCDTNMDANLQFYWIEPPTEPTT